MNILREKLINRLLHSLDENFPLGLTYGKMGVCIYLYQLERFGETNHYEIRADKILDDILGEISSIESLNVEEGLAGIALGLTFLVREKHIQADLNFLLKDIDDLIYKHLAFHENKNLIPIKDILGYIYYFNIRLEENPNKHDQYIFENIIASLVEYLFENIKENVLDDYDTFSIYYYELPLLLFVFANLLKKDIYTSRILHLLDEWKIRIITRLPLLHMNRLYLLCGMLAIKPFLKDIDFIQYPDRIKKNINIEYLIKKKIKAKNLFISNGFSLLYILLTFINKNYPSYNFIYNKNEIIHLIETSPAWKELDKNPSFYRIHRGLLNGFLGVDLVLSSNKILNQ